MRVYLPKYQTHSVHRRCMYNVDQCCSAISSGTLLYWQDYSYRVISTVCTTFTEINESNTMQLFATF